MYCLKEFPDFKEKGVVVGFDARHNSQTYAKIAASVFISKGVTVYLFPSICATPHVPFTVLKTGARFGIMITASHNPKEDNGYKAYWGNGAQIVTPIDKYVQESIMENLAPWDCKPSDVDSSPLIKDAGKICWDAYFEKISSVLSKHKRFGTVIPPTKIVFTPMHGVAYRFIQRAFEAFGLEPVIPTVEQIEPDPEFPTAPFPNPEEKGTLKYAEATAEKAGVTIIIATDPDADRCTFSEYDKKTKKWKCFTGDEIGAIIAYRQFLDWKETHPNVPTSNLAMVNSAVSSRFIDLMAKKEGFHTSQTLTGFKWIGNKMLEYEKQGIDAVLGYEEAIGYCCNAKIGLDKDGISALSIVGELIALTYAKGKTMHELLEDIYKLYGYDVCHNSYFMCNEPETVKRIFDRLRTAGKGAKENEEYGDDYLRSATNPRTKRTYYVKTVRDLHVGYDSSSSDKKATLPTQPNAEMITYTFTDGAVMTLRTSGTEPKIKYYSELIGPNKEEMAKELEELVETIVEYFLEPEKNELEPPVVE